MNKKSKEKQLELNKLTLEEYVTVKPGKVEFILPGENDNNSNLNCEVKRYFKYKTKGIKFFFDKDEYENLLTLYNKYRFPERIRDDLTMAYLNMRYAYLLCAEQEKERDEQDNLCKEADKLLKIFDSISEDSSTLVQINLVVRNPTSNEVDSITLINNNSYNPGLWFFIEAIKNYKNNSNYFHLKCFSDEIKNPNPLNKLENLNKNLLKEKQENHCIIIFDFLSNEIFPLAYSPEWEYQEYLNLKEKAKRKYPSNKKLLFIGELMIFSKLLPIEFINDQKLLDLMKKKLKSKEKKDKEHFDFSMELHKYPEKFKKKAVTS